MYTSLFHLLAPSFCAFCRIFLPEPLVLCHPCSARIRHIGAYPLEISTTKKIMVHALGAYEQPLISLILAKGGGNRTIAHQLGQLVWRMSAVSQLSFDWVIPIPLHWTRYAWRGYNQAEEIASVIAKKANIPLAHLIKRVRRTPLQSHFKKEARIKNVHEAFALCTTTPRDYKDTHLLLVDDVMISGATLKQVVKTLTALRPASITAIVVARVT